MANYLGTSQHQDPMTDQAIPYDLRMYHNATASPLVAVLLVHIIQFNSIQNTLLIRITYYSYIGWYIIKSTHTNIYFMAHNHDNTTGC